MNNIDLINNFTSKLPERNHLVVILQALFVTLLWSSSYILIDIGLQSIPSLTFAGLRYTIAFLCLLPFAVRSPHREVLNHLSFRDWGMLVALGIFMYALTQGAQFVAIEHIPAASVSLFYNLTPIAVVGIGFLALDERPALLQHLGVVVTVAGAVLYFYPPVFPTDRAIGLSVMTFGLLGNASASVVGRLLNNTDKTTPIVVTVGSMGVGGPMLLVAGITTQSLPSLSLTSWAIVGWLAVINTAFAFTLWNHTLQRLTAVESSVINNTMLVQVAVLGWVFLGQSLSPLEIIGLLVATMGTGIVQFRE